MSQLGGSPNTPLGVAKAFLAGIKTRDVSAMRALVHPDATACLIREQVPRHFKLSEVLSIIEAADSDMDEYSYDEVEHVDDDYAIVWTPYKFVEDGKLHHTGTNTFVLWKSPDGWLITAVSDVARAVEAGATMRLIAGST